MGKKRIVTESGKSDDSKKSGSSISKKRADIGILNIQSTYNNTKVVLTDTKGNTLAWGSCGNMGFRGAKKGTPFAAAKVGEGLGMKALAMGMRQISVVVKGVGAGRESAIRGFISKGNFEIAGIRDVTPIPHNGPKPKKPRRV